jgi:hypothetical protein
VNSPTDLTASRTLALLNDLKAHVASATHAEEQLNAAMRTRRFHADRKYQGAAKSIEERHSAQQEEINAHYDTMDAQVRRTHEERQARLLRFKNSGTRNLGRMAQEQREQFLGKLQMKKVQLERAYAAQTKELTEQFNTRADELTLSGEAIAKAMKAAQSYFAGYGAFRKLLRQRSEVTPPTDHAAVLASIESKLTEAKEAMFVFREQSLPRLFSIMPLPMALLLLTIIAVAGGFLLGGDQAAFVKSGGISGALLVLVLVLYFIGLTSSKPQAEATAGSITAAHDLHRAATAALQSNYDTETARLKADHEKSMASFKDQWSGVDTVQKEFETSAKEKLTNVVPQLMEKNDELLMSKVRYVASQRDEQLRLRQADADTALELHAKARDAELATIATEEAAQLAQIEAAWKRDVLPLYQEISAINAAPTSSFPAWDKNFVDTWIAPTQFHSATRLGSVALTLPPEALPKHANLALPGPADITLPVALSYPQLGSVLIETNEASGGAISETINNIILRLLCTTPPGKVAFTILDPVGLGQNFAGVMHLGDYEETLINRRIWTQRDQIEERLQELNDHIEKVIQMYLRNEYETITQYNEQAGSTAEKYHFLVVADFPNGFSDVAGKRLQSIAVSGPRCGVFTLIHRDLRALNPDGFVADELRKSSVCIRQEGKRFVLDGAPADAVLTLDAAPSDELAVPLLHKIGKASIDSNRVELPFDQIAPKNGHLWTEDTTTELRVPIGRTGATKLQYLSIGKGTKQHALFAGKTGSGKSTLFHIIITNLALYHSPDQVEFYLIDFKKGVEFKCYANSRLPHARVVAIESDREFALSVLLRVDEELKRRGDMFRKLGAQDIAGYKRAGGTEPMPRSLLLIDEFQEFFVEDDTIAQTASVLFDRIVRQGRAFGIHVLLGSQTLGGAFTLARATMGQMVIRVALQCNEADAYLIMDESNPAPRLLTRPGEGIYNDSAGAIEGNSPFQVSWLNDEERDEWLHKVRVLADEKHDKHAGPIVFEGNAPAEVAENYLLSAALANKPTQAPTAARLWLGAPNSIKGPTEAVFHRQSGNHLLVVSQREEVTLSMFAIGLISLAAQYPQGMAKFIFLHNTPEGTPDSRFLDRIFKLVPHGLTVAQGHNLADVMTELGEDLKSRTSGEVVNGPAVFLFIHGLHKFKKLKADDDLDFSFSSSDSGPSPASQLSSIITEGSSQGIHLVISTDTYNNVTRFLSRKLLSEFEMRVVFQMSANDSASLIDTPKAANLGLHRAILHNEQAGTLETFRPYAEPTGVWLEEVAEKL